MLVANEVTIVSCGSLSLPHFMNVYDDCATLPGTSPYLWQSSKSPAPLHTAVPLYPALQDTAPVPATFLTPNLGSLYMTLSQEGWPSVRKALSTTGRHIPTVCCAMLSMLQSWFSPDKQSPVNRPVVPQSVVSVFDRLSFQLASPSKDPGLIEAHRKAVPVADMSEPIEFSRQSCEVLPNPHTSTIALFVPQAYCLS